MVTPNPVGSLLRRPLFHKQAPEDRDPYIRHPSCLNPSFKEAAMASLASKVKAGWGSAPARAFLSR